MMRRPLQPSAAQSGAGELAEATWAALPVIAAVWTGWSIWAPLPQAASMAARVAAIAVRKAEIFMIQGNAKLIDASL